MKETEKQVMCALLQVLWDKALITQDIHDKSREVILASCDSLDCLCGFEGAEKGVSDEHS